MPRFKAFISYKHIASTRFAENLELALKAYSKPLLRPPVPIFRDEKYLRPGADLPAMIREALADSEYLIYLASPEAAASTWVQSELVEWCADDSRLKRLIIVLTGGSIATDMATHQVNWAGTDAIPDVLADRLVKVPLYVDLSWASTPEQQTILNPDYKKAINLIVATLRHVDPIELTGQEILQHRRNLRLRNAALALITSLTVLAGIAAWFAWNQKLVADTRAREATEQRALAEARARDATSRRLATEVVRIAEDRPDTALLLTVNAYRMGDNAALRSAWWRLLGSRPSAATYLPATATDLRFDPDGTLVLENGARYIQSDQRWVEKAATTSVPFAGAPSWSWSGGCEQDECEEQDAAFWECARTASRIIGPYGDQDNFCVASRVHVEDWCGQSVLEVPGFEVNLERDGSWLRLRTNKGSALYACAVGEARLVAGDPAFFPPTPAVERARVGGGSPVRRQSVSFDGRWLALVREEGSVELWPIVEEGAEPTRRGAVVLNLPAAADAIATSPDGAMAIALASTTSGGQGEILLWKDFHTALAGKPADRAIPNAWHRRGKDGVLALSDDGRRLAAGADVELSIVDTSTGEIVATPYLGRNAATTAQLSPDGKRLLVTPRPLDGAVNSSAWLVDLEHDDDPFAIGVGVATAAFHPVLADTLILGGRKGMHVRGLQRGAAEERLAAEPVDKLITDRQRRLLAASLGDRRVFVLDLARRESPALSDKRDQPATGLAFLSSASAVLWASDAGLETWDWSDDEWSVIDTAAHADVRSLPDWRALAVSGGHAVIYDLSPERWTGLTCDAVRRNLSIEEWQKYVGKDVPYECACPELPSGDGSGLSDCRSH